MPRNSGWAVRSGARISIRPRSRRAAGNRDGVDQFGAGLTPFAAFAGHKQSGFGVENGMEGLREFTVPQTIYVPQAAG